MSVAETVLIAITRAVFGYVLQQANLSARVRLALDREPEQLAFRRALGGALEQLKHEHPDWISALFDASFFENEGAPILAQFMIRNGRPDPSELAACWANSLNIQHARQRTALTRELEPVAAGFLDNLATGLKAEPELGDLNDSRAIEQVSSSLQTLLHKLEAEQATPGTRRDYLQWLIQRNNYLDPRGARQTERQVQMKLEDVYVSLQAQREEAPGTVDRRLLEQSIADLEVRADQGEFLTDGIDDQQRQPTARMNGSQLVGSSALPGEVLELAEVVNRHERLVILGDPGSGKSTLLRYLALKHAQASWEGEPDAENNLGPVHFPILIRIADYVQSDAWKQKPISRCLADLYELHECPKGGLEDLLTNELTSGNCLILLDGLDEVVTADDRRIVVERIQDFARRYGGRSNRFVITSRVAGYRTAPLGAPFIHYTIEEMDDSQIRRFLHLWCSAVEAAQTPDLAPEIREQKAQQEVNGILSAVQSSPGVRRLAANPLLLRTLALIHRTGARLPQKRIDLYRLAADTLARTWRTAQGVPEAVLVQEEYLAPLLSKLAYWLHNTKPNGVATEQEVYMVLGEEWARIKELSWDPDDPSPMIRRGVNEFLLAVREHTGLFVERAPRQYGFMHLTFEEYFAARYLVARSRTRAKMIRKHLLDPRWEEPILLALGFVGLDYPEEAAELFEAAVLAKGEEAIEAGFKRSPHEDLLGREFLFALRCLGDQIPASRTVVRQLTERVFNELLYQYGSASYSRYRHRLLQRLKHLQGTEAAAEIAAMCSAALNHIDAEVKYRAAQCLIHLGHVQPETVELCLTGSETAGTQKHQDVMATLLQLDRVPPDVVDVLLEHFRGKRATAESLVTLLHLAEESPDLVETLLHRIQNETSNLRKTAAMVLMISLSGELASHYKGLDIDSSVVKALLSAQTSADDELYPLLSIPLASLAKQSPKIIEAILQDSDSDQLRIRRSAIVTLTLMEKQKSPQVVEALLKALKDDNWNVRMTAAGGLGRLHDNSPQVIEALQVALKDDEAMVRRTAASSLNQLNLVSSEIMGILFEGLHHENSDVRRQTLGVVSLTRQSPPEICDAVLASLNDTDSAVQKEAQEKLEQLIHWSPKAIEVLLQRMRSGESSEHHVKRAFGRIQQLSNEGVQSLLKYCFDTHSAVRNLVQRTLKKLTSESDEATAALRAALVDGDPKERAAAAVSLAQSGGRSSEVVEALLTGLHSDENWSVRRDCADRLGDISICDEQVFDALRLALIDDDDDVRTACAGALAMLGRGCSEDTDSIIGKLIEALTNSNFDSLDAVSYRSGHDYAFDSLWMLVTGELT